MFVDILRLSCEDASLGTSQAKPWKRGGEARTEIHGVDFRRLGILEDMVLLNEREVLG